MERPYKYMILSKTSEIVSETDSLPLLHQLQTWEATDNPDVRTLEQTRTAHMDIRYAAKLRLYNYVTYGRKGLEVPSYRNAIKGTEIGKSIPILNF